MKFLIDYENEKHMKDINNILVIDTETTGFPKTIGWDVYYPFTELDKYDRSRVIRLSWALYNTDGEIVGSLHDYMFNYDDVTTIENSHIHGITIDDLHSKGVDWSNMITEFIDVIQSSDMIVGHNLLFDLHVLSSELYRQGYKEVAASLIEIKKHYCTMKEGRIITNIKIGSVYKNPKLGELYYSLFSEEMPHHHISTWDVVHTAKCFFEMNRIIPHLQS